MTPEELESIKRSGNLFAFGVVPSLLSEKDFVAPPAAPGASPPSFTHLAYRKLPLKNQQGGTCVGNTGALAEEMFEYVETKRVISFNGEELNGRVLHQLDGASPADIWEFMRKYGVETEVDGEKGVWLLAGYARVDNRDQEAVKAAISGGGVLALSIWLQDTFGQVEGVDYRTYYEPKNDTRIWGYHEVTVVGYDAKGVIIQNSWGPHWGDGGFWRLSWDYVMSERVGEAWVLTDSPNAAGGYIRTWWTDINAKERAVKHKETATSKRPAVYRVLPNGREWIRDPFEAKRMGVNLSLVERLDDTDPVWDLPVIGLDAPKDLR